MEDRRERLLDKLVVAKSQEELELVQAKIELLDAAARRDAQEQ